MKKTWLMIAALVLILAIGAMVSLKWLYVQDVDGKTTITIDRNEMKEDVEKALGEGKSLLRDTEKRIRDESHGDAVQPKE
jgi:hypothetical protein